jgi:hypothetical protein
MGRYVQVDEMSGTQVCGARRGYEPDHESGELLRIGEWMMRFLVALIGGLFMFVTVGFLCGLALLWLAPAEWARTEVSYQGYSGNIVTVVSVLVGALGGMYAFTALLRMKTSGSSGGGSNVRAQMQRRQPEMEQETNLLHRLS